MKDNNNLHFKDCTPEETIAKIQSILNENEIEVEEIWKKHDDTINTYSTRLVYKGTSIGTNGKGVSEVYARASAYAEFMERYQNGILTNYSTGQDEKFNFYIDPDEKILSAEQIVKDNSSFIRQYFKFRNMENCTDDEKVLAYKKIQSTEKILHNKTNYYITIPFYNQSRNVIEYLPVNTYSLCYGSNGMCAGNTRDEAIVQGLSEIFERYIQLKIIKERLVVPDIPVDYIKKFPYVYTMYDELTKKSGYSVKLKDCSLGGKYPVAALIVIEKNTGRYGIKFGCHPDYGIAMERAFTEATQGKSIEEYAISGIFDFENLNVATDNNTLNALQIGVAQYPYEFFTCTNEVIFTPVEEVSDKSNKQILINWLDFIKNSGFDVLVRDVSYLGFPSYHVIIPGISEVNNMTDAKFRLLNTRRYINKKLEDEICPYTIVYRGF